MSAETTIGTVRALLEGALAATDDSEVRFKLRSALQLLIIIENRHEAASDALDDAELDDEVRENLSELGYL